MEAMDIDACQIHINSLGNNRLTWYCILFFKIATQDAKSLFSESHKSGKNFFEDVSSWTFWQIYLDKWVLEVDYRRLSLPLGKVVSDEDITFLFIGENIGWDSFYWFFIMKMTSHNITFEWRLRLVERRYAQAALLGTALVNNLTCMNVT